MTDSWSLFHVMGAADTINYNYPYKAQSSNKHIFYRNTSVIINN